MRVRLSYGFPKFALWFVRYPKEAQAWESRREYNLMGTRGSWRASPDCKSGARWLSRFESYRAHHLCQCAIGRRVRLRDLTTAETGRVSREGPL